MKRILSTVMFFLVPILFPLAGLASGWSWNIGYNNPPGAQLGLNFMHLWNNWAFEFGVGNAKAVSTEDDKNTPQDEEEKVAALYGDLNLKYLFSSGTVRPYLQIGMGAGMAVSSKDELAASAGMGGTYGGIGIFLLGNPFYVYGSYNMLNGNFFQLGLGFDL